MARVLPVPAPARIRTGPSMVVAASCCPEFSSSRSVMLGGGPAWEGTFYPTGTLSANSRSEQGLPRGNIAEIDLEKEEGLVVRHKGEIRDVKVRVVDCAKVVVQIEEEK